MLVAYTVVLVSTSLDVLIGTMFVIGICATARVNCGFIYMMEFVPQQHHAMIASAVFVFEALITVYGSVYFSFISNYWLWLVLFGYII